MDIRLWDRDKDYPVLAGWWKEYNWEPVANEILPNDGFIVTVGDQGIAAGFFYLSNSAPIAYADWFITNPHASAKHRHVAIKRIYEKIEEACRADGCKIITATITSKTLVKRMMRDHGYEVASHKVMQMIRVLDDGDIGFMDYFRDQDAIDQNSPVEDRKSDNLPEFDEEKIQLLQRAENDEIS